MSSLAEARWSQAHQAFYTVDLFSRERRWMIEPPERILEPPPPPQRPPAETEGDGVDTLGNALAGVPALNFLREALLELHAPALTNAALDLAAGQAHDLLKYKLRRARRACLVDRSVDQLVAALEHIKQTNERNPVPVKLVSADPRRQSLREAGALAPGETFSLVALGCSLPQYFGRAEHLQSLVRTLDEALELGGVVVGLTTTEARTRALEPFEARGVSFRRPDARQYSAVAGRKLVREWHVRWPEFADACAHIGLRLVCFEPAEAFLARALRHPRALAVAQKTRFVSDGRANVSEADARLLQLYSVFALVRERQSVRERGHPSAREFEYSPRPRFGDIVQK